MAAIRPAADATQLAAGGPNSIAYATGVIGDEWSALIVATALRHGHTRFGDWRATSGMSTSVLSARLASLVEAGVLRRIATARGEYHLTKRGRELWPVVLALWAWEKHHTGFANPLITDVRHDACGASAEPALTCKACQRPVERKDIAARFGPSGSWRRSVPVSASRRRPNADDGRPRLMVGRILGDRTSCAIVAAAALGSTRFSEFERRSQANPSVVAERLRTFCELGILEVRPSADRHDRMEYHFTERGERFFPLIAVVTAWAEKWFVSPEGPALVQTHLDCGAEFAPRLVCAHCDKQLHGLSFRHAEEDRAG